MRQMRGLRPDNNPLRRGSDRAETAVAAGLLAAFLASAPAATVAAGNWARAVAAAVDALAEAVMRDIQNA